ncbi:MAG: inositol monophosphatase family protein, partial [Arenimonas sp.]
IKNELFTASKGKGALLNDRKIRVTDRKDLSGALVITGTPPRDRGRIGPHLDFCKALLSTAEDIRRTGSAALDLAYVACGRSDAYFESGIKAWDVAGGMLLVREAGGCVSDFKGRGERILDAGNIVAGNVRINPMLQAAIAQSEYGKSF